MYQQNTNNINQQENGCWDKFFDQTSKDGFNRPLRRKKDGREASNWETLQNKTSATGFAKVTNQYSSKAKNIIPPDHWEKGSMMVQVNDEGGLWNRKPLYKRNTAVKESHAFDAFRNPPQQEEIDQRYHDLYKNRALNDIKELNYDKFYQMDAKPGYNQNSEYRQNYDGIEQDDFQKNKKVPPRQALPTPYYMQGLIEYKRHNNVLNN